MEVRLAGKKCRRCSWKGLRARSGGCRVQGEDRGVDVKTSSLAGPGAEVSEVSGGSGHIRSLYLNPPSSVRIT